MGGCHSSNEVIKMWDKADCIMHEMGTYVLAWILVGPAGNCSGGYDRTYGPLIAKTGTVTEVCNLPNFCRTSKLSSERPITTFDVINISNIPKSVTKD